MDSAERLAVMAQLAARMADAGLAQPAMAAGPKPTDGLTRTLQRNLHGRRAVSRFLLVLLMLAVTAGAVVAYKDPEQLARASDSVSRHAAQREPSAGARRPDPARSGR